MKLLYVRGKEDRAEKCDPIWTETMPFFVEKRVIMLEDTGFFKNQCTDLPEYMAELPDYLCMVFVENEVDKRSRMFKAVKKYGRVVEFAKQDSQTLIRWC